MLSPPPAGLLDAAGPGAAAAGRRAALRREGPGRARLRADLGAEDGAGRRAGAGERGVPAGVGKRKKKKRHTCILRDFSRCAPVFFAMRERCASSRVPFAISRFLRDFS